MTSGALSSGSLATRHFKLEVLGLLARPIFDYFGFADNAGVGGDKRVYEDLSYFPFANPRSAQWRATELWVEEA